MDDINSHDVLWQALRQLQGRKFRLVRPGEFVTADVQSGRLTLYVDEEGRISGVTLDPELPTI